MYVISRNGNIVKQAYVTGVDSQGKPTNEIDVVVKDITFKTETAALEVANLWEDAVVLYVNN